ncbi:MAG: hypothetical protein PVI86_18725 [Phycisphaerae bacterium]|jgi:hypothetical protein
MSERSKLEEYLLAVDIGLRTGLALFARDGRLRWYRSQHFADATALRRAVRRLLKENEGVTMICLEGGGPLGDIWEKEAAARGIATRHVAAETWRAQLFYDRQHRDGKQAKRTANEMARRVINWSEAPKPTSLRHDVSEAILIGLWGVLDAGWLDHVPLGIRG